MPYAQQHYPFENKERFEKNFPADFIAEVKTRTSYIYPYIHRYRDRDRDRDISDFMAEVCEAKIPVLSIQIHFISSIHIHVSINIYVSTHPHT